MKKKGLCFKCGKRDHRANQRKTKEETGAEGGMQAVQVEDQEPVFSWMNNWVCTSSMQWKDACANEYVGDSLWWHALWMWLERDQVEWLWLS